MKRTGIKRPTYEEALARVRAQRERQRAKALAARTKPKEPKPKVKPKKDRVKTLKRKLWTAFSRYIRKSYADKNGMVMTADGKFMRWEESHCGHLYNNSERNQSLGGNELWYDERNFAPQSMPGNYYNADDSAKVYMGWAIRRYGDEVVQQMFRMKHTARKFTEAELEEKLRHYVEAFARL